MRIAFDAHVIGERETGNETYTANLLRALIANPDGDEYQLLTPHPERLASFGPLPPSFSTVRVGPAVSALRIPFGMPRAIRREQSQVLHVSYVAPPIVPCPTVVTVHDLSYVVYPKSHPLRTRLILGSQVPRSARRAARVIAVSRRTAEDLTRFYRIPPEKISVIYEAAGPAFQRLPDARTRPLPAGVREPYILAVGNLEPRKNLDRLIQAFAGLTRGNDNAREITDAPQLVLVGQPRAALPELQRLCQREGVADRVRFLGFVDEDQLVLLYNRAALFAYPSLYEGFGLPPLEAMACGCPVVASNTSAIPEVCGDGALLVDPTSVEALAAAMAAILSDASLAAGLRERGAQQARRYSWDRAAAETQSVYRQAAGAARERVSPA